MNNSLAAMRPHLALEWHPTKNGDLTPADVTFGKQLKVWWLCPSCGHEWQAIIGARSSGAGCPSCAGRLQKSLAETDPLVALQWHPTKNGDLTPENVTRGMDRKAWWLGACGHEWQTSISAKVRGSSCPICAGRAVLPGYNDLAFLLPELAAEWHPTKNGDLLPAMVTCGMKKSVWWLGACGHEWQARIESRALKNSGCPICAGKQLLPGYNDLATVMPELAAEWHPTKNGDLSPDQVTKGMGQKVWWLGSCGHEWKAGINSRSSGSGCPCCTNESKTSFPEQAIFFYLSKVTAAESRFQLQGQTEIDIYLPEYQIGIEYDGQTWHQDINRDLKKNALCEQKGIRLIRVREPGCPSIPAECFILSSLRTDELNAAIEKLLRLLGKNECVNVERDRSDIYDQYVENEKKNSLAAKSPEIAAEWHPTKNGSITPEKVKNGSYKKVWWLGSCGHEWQAKINTRVKTKCGCPFCSGLRVIVGENDLVTTNPTLAAEWHPVKNGGLLPNEVAKNSGKRVWWLCSCCGHEWLAPVYNRNRGTGCPVCRNARMTEALVIKRGSLATSLPSLAAEWHPTKNGDLTPEKVTCKNRKKVWWLGSCGHEWQAKICDRAIGKGCPYCAATHGRALAGYNDLATVMPELAAQWHPTKNDDLTPKQVKAGSHKKVWWLGPCGHEWQAAIKNRSAGKGCPICAGRRTTTIDITHPSIAAEWHPTRNETPTPEGITAGATKRAWWLGPCGHEWQTTVQTRTRGAGCPFCAKRGRPRKNPR